MIPISLEPNAIRCIALYCALLDGEPPTDLQHAGDLLDQTLLRAEIYETWIQGTMTRPEIMKHVRR